MSGPLRGGTSSGDVGESTVAAPLEVSAVSANLPFVLRTYVSFAALAVGTNVIGVLLVALLVTVTNAAATDHQFTVLLTTGAILTVLFVIVGVASATLVQRRTLRWMLRGEQPTRADSRRALRLPLDIAVITASLWTFGGAVIGVVSGTVGEDVRTIVGVVGGVVLSGLTSAGLIYLVMGRFNLQVARIALEAAPPRKSPIFGMQWRLVSNWLLTSAVPLVGLMLVLSAPQGRTHRVSASIVVAALAILVGGLSTLLISRTIGAPLRNLVDALHSVGEGHLDVEVQLTDSGEIGLVENGFNTMVAGLRERERVEDLFGRHVGPAVAAEAISGGVTLTGESRDVVALFVDITGSTRLTRLTEPGDFVAMLNRFFEIVVDEVEGNGGLLNKFEGDAALCVFGAPAKLDDPATAALRTARAIRDRVARMAELQVGIGVACGPVIAGQIGAASRLEYTIIGDAVNEAARLTELAKRVDGRILASESTVEAADAHERNEWVRGKSMRLRGRDELTHSFHTATSPQETPASLQRRLADVARTVAELPNLPSLPGKRD
ncbi:MAG: adenylate/guanylate cyclase domain-containing protein [Jatrophihabitans sp.]